MADIRPIFLKNWRRMDSDLLRKLLDLGDAFEQQHPKPDERSLSRFLGWASQQQEQEPDSAAAPVYYTDTAPVLPTFIAQYLTIGYRYFRFYVKKALETTPLVTFDDFVSLVYLVERGHLTKTELVDITINERTSGMLVIKRLVDRGFVLQSDDTHDRRSRQLTITPEGMKLLQTVQPAMNQATTLLKGNLSVGEQQQLGTLLARLDAFHRPLYTRYRDAPLDELISMVNKTD